MSRDRNAALGGQPHSVLLTECTGVSCSKTCAAGAGAGGGEGGGGQLALALAPSSMASSNSAALRPCSGGIA